MDGSFSDFINTIIETTFQAYVPENNCCQTKRDIESNSLHNFIAVLLVDGKNCEYYGHAIDIHDFEKQIHKSFRNTDEFGDWKEYKVVRIFQGTKEI